MENKYIKVKIPRAVKPGEYNVNGFRYEPESFDKALKQYVESFGAVCLHHDSKKFEDNFIINPTTLVGRVYKYDNDYFYINLYENYKDLYEKYKDKLYILVVSLTDSKDKTNMIIQRVTKLQINIDENDLILRCKPL